MELSRVDEQLGDKETDSEFSSSPTFSEGISDFPKKGHGASGFSCGNRQPSRWGHWCHHRVADGHRSYTSLSGSGRSLVEHVPWGGVVVLRMVNSWNPKSEQIPKHIHKFSEICENFEWEFWRSKTAVACSYTVTQELTLRRQKSEHILFPYYFARHVYKSWRSLHQELGDSTLFMYFVDTGFWSKYGHLQKIIVSSDIDVPWVVLSGTLLFVQVESGEFFQAAQLSNSNRKVLPFPSYHWTLVHSSFSSMSKGQWGNREYDAATATSPAAAAVRQVKFGMNMDGCFAFFRCFLLTLVEFGHIAWNLLKYMALKEQKDLLEPGFEQTLGMTRLPPRFVSHGNGQVHAYLDRLAGALPGCVKAKSLGRGLPPDSFAGPPAVWKPARGDNMLLRVWRLAARRHAKSRTKYQKMRSKDTANSHDFSLFSICFQVSLFYKYDSARNDGKFVWIFFFVLEVETSDRGLWQIW